MSADEALDVVVARVRDRKDVRIGPGPWRRLLRNEGLPAFFVLEIFFIVGGLAKRAWRLSLLGLAMTVAALAILLAPQR